jgi:hypothetical protein
MFTLSVISGRLCQNIRYGFAFMFFLSLCI